MAKTKELSPAELLNKILELPLDVKAEMVTSLKLNIENEATALKQKGDAAYKILQSIENGK